MARKKKEIKQDNFYMIRYWMPEKLNLGGTKLLVYGYIYAYSVNENSKGYYYGGQETMSRATGCSKRQLLRVLESLRDEGLIEIKKATLENGLERNYYRVTAEPLVGIASKEDLDTLKGTLDAWKDCINTESCKEVMGVY